MSSGSRSHCASAGMQPVSIDEQDSPAPGDLHSAGPEIACPWRHLRFKRALTTGWARSSGSPDEQFNHAQVNSRGCAKTCHLLYRRSIILKNIHQTVATFRFAIHVSLCQEKKQFS